MKLNHKLHTNNDNTKEKNNNVFLDTFSIQFLFDRIKQNEKKMQFNDHDLSLKFHRGCDVLVALNIPGVALLTFHVY